MKENKGYVILAETGSDLPKELAEKYNVVIVPMHVMFDNKNYNDGEFPVSQIIDYYKRTKKVPKTSATNVGEYMTAFESIHEQYPEKIIIHLCYSAVTTATYQNALIASEGLDYICHIDTKSVSAGHAFIIYKTAKYIESHPEIELEELKNYIYELINKTHMNFLPYQLDFLKAGGRVSNVAYLGASVLGLKPMIEIVDGKLVCTKKYRGRDFEKVCKKMFKEIIEQYTVDKTDVFLIYSHGLDKEIKNSLETFVKPYFERIQWVKTGGVITTHGGPSCFGVVFCE